VKTVLEEDEEGEGETDDKQNEDGQDNEDALEGFKEHEDVDAPTGEAAYKEYEVDPSKKHRIRATEPLSRAWMHRESRRRPQAGACRRGERSRRRQHVAGSMKSAAVPPLGRA